MRILPYSACALALTLLAAPLAAQRTACCTVSRIDASTGTASGVVTASGYIFEFKPRVPSTLASLRAGQAIHANFSNNQISLDGRTLWGTVTKAPAPPASRAA
jgi:hypothetical protein